MGFSGQEMEWVAIPFSRGSIVLTQASNTGLLHSRQILYHLNYQESPTLMIVLTWICQDVQSFSKILWNSLQTWGGHSMPTCLYSGALWISHPSLSHTYLQFSSVTQSCPTLCDPMNCSMPGLPVHHQLPEFTQTHVHQVGDAIQPSHPLLSPSPPAPNPSQHQSLFQWVNSSHQVAKVLEFQL